jgi:hypothetical protein
VTVVSSSTAKRWGGAGLARRRCARPLQRFRATVTVVSSSFAKRRLSVDAFVLNNNADATTTSPALDSPPRPRGAHSREKSRRSCAAGEEAVPARQGSDGGAWSTGERRAGAKEGDFPLTH